MLAVCDQQPSMLSFVSFLYFSFKSFKASKLGVYNHVQAKRRFCHLNVRLFVGQVFLFEKGFVDQYRAVQN